MTGLKRIPDIGIFRAFTQPGGWMPVPDFQTIMLPLLQSASDGELRSSKEYRDLLAQHFELTQEELDEMLPSQRAPLFSNRVAWAMTYLHRAGLMTRPKRGHYKITDVGRDVLKSSPKALNIKYLERFPEYIEWKNSFSDSSKPNQEDETEDLTPEEVLDKSYLRIRRQLVADLLDQVKSGTPQFFEMLVVKLLVAMGYGGTMKDAGMAVGKSGDEGIDGIIKEDRLGLDVIYLQAKKWDSTVGRPEIQKFVGALQGKRAKKGVFMTTGTFAQGAVEYASLIDTKIILIDGEKLAEYMIDFGVGVTTKEVYEVKRVDTDFFIEE